MEKSRKHFVRGGLAGALAILLLILLSGVAVAYTGGGDRGGAWSRSVLRLCLFAPRRSGGGGNASNQWLRRCAGGHQVAGHLVEMPAAYTPPGGDDHSRLALQAEGIEVLVAPVEGVASSPVVPLDAVDAETLLRIDAGLEVGYGGFYHCESSTE